MSELPEQETIRSLDSARGMFYVHNLLLLFLECLFMGTAGHSEGVKYYFLLARLGVLTFPKSAVSDLSGCCTHLTPPCLLSLLGRAALKGLCRVPEVSPFSFGKKQEFVGEGR